MLRKRKKYSRPRTPFDKARIEEEAKLKEKYGLKNKKEIWKADESIRKIRHLAQQLITQPEEKQKKLIKKLQKRGFEVKNLADVLSLDKEDWLKRRLQTIVFKKGLARTPKQARQFIVHNHVLIGDRIVNIPSYQVSLDEEPLVQLRLRLKEEPQQKTKIEKIKAEVKEE